MKHLKILNGFAKHHGKRIGVDITVSEHKTSFEPLYYEGASYEDVMMVSSLLTGAQNFVYWLERNRYKICKK